MQESLPHNFWVLMNFQWNNEYESVSLYRLALTTRKVWSYCTSPSFHLLRLCVNFTSDLFPVSTSPFRKKTCVTICRRRVRLFRHNPRHMANLPGYHK